MKLSGLGRFPVIEARSLAPRSPEALQAMVRSEPSLIARGNGRAYGDSAINPAATLHTRHLNRMLAFDAATGQLTAEAGVLLGDIIAAFLPRGWFPLVTPGTKLVTLGGAIAADVHGKNHPRDGSFRACVDWIDLVGPDGSLQRCTPGTELFDLTLGGMGLTGVILRAAIRLRRVETAWIRQTLRALPSLAATLDAFEAARDAPYSVAWIDCLGPPATRGRALLMLGAHATRAELPPGRDPLRSPPRRRRTVPVDLPAALLNGPTLRAFNALYWRAGRRREGTRLVDWDSFFYPLDALAGWNRLYGRNGLAQFQCVLPPARSEAGLAALMDEIARSGAGACLAVLKRFGPGQGAVSFPMEGYTLALDFPVTRRTLALLDRLDAIALAHQGRFYLAKDSRMRAETLHAADPRLSAFRSRRDRLGLNPRFRSAQSERLAL